MCYKDHKVRNHIELEREKERTTREEEKKDRGMKLRE